MTFEHIYPHIPERLVFHKENYKVLTVFEARSTIFRKGESGEETVTLGLILPKIPEKGNETPTFDMNLVKIVDGEFSTSATDYIRLSSNGELGFIVSGIGYKGINLDKEESLDVYREQGMSRKIDSLKTLIDRHRNKLTNKNPNQFEWENAALLMAPILVRFFVLTPGEQGQLTI